MGNKYLTKVYLSLCFLFSLTSVAREKKHEICLGFGRLNNVFDQEIEFERTIGLHSEIKSSYYIESKYYFKIKTFKFISFKTGLVNLNIFIKTQKDPDINIGEKWPEHSIFQVILFSSNKTTFNTGFKKVLTNLSFGINLGKSILIQNKITNNYQNAAMTKPINYFFTARDKNIIQLQFDASVTICQLFENKVAISINTLKSLTPMYSGASKQNNFFYGTAFQFNF